MNREEAHGLLNKLLAVRQHLDETWTAFERLTGSQAESPLNEAVWEPVDLLVDCVSRLIGDEHEAVNWFIYEAQCGARDMDYSLPNNEMRTVKTIDDLLDVLGITE